MIRCFCRLTFRHKKQDFCCSVTIQDYALGHVNRPGVNGVAPWSSLYQTAQLAQDPQFPGSNHASVHYKTWGTSALEFLMFICFRRSLCSLFCLCSKAFLTFAGGPVLTFLPNWQTRSVPLVPWYLWQLLSSSSKMRQSALHDFTTLPMQDAWCFSELCTGLQFHAKMLNLIFGQNTSL